MKQEDKFIETMNQIVKKGIENIPYQETLKELEKHCPKEFLTEEAKKASKKD